MTIPTLRSRIESVTVYRSEAAITRISDIDLTKAPFPEEVQIAGLPLCLDDGSVTVKVEPVGGGGVPEACDVRIGLDVLPPDPELEPPKNEQLQEAKRTVSEIETEIEQLDQMVLKLQELQAPDRPRGERGKAPPPTPTAARLTLLEFRQGELGDLGAQRTGLLKKLEDARDVLDVMQRRDAAASSARQAREDELRKSVAVRLHKTNGDSLAPACHLIVEYLVPGARWVPNYVIRFNEEEDSAELAMRALLCQDTGEDWKDVRMRVATADPERWSELPELPALRIGRLQPSPRKTGWRTAPAGVDELFADYDRAVESTELAEELMEDSVTRSVSREEFKAQNAILLEELDEEVMLTGAAPDEEEITGEYLTELSASAAMDELEPPAPPVRPAAMPGKAFKAAGMVPSLKARKHALSESLDDVLSEVTAPAAGEKELTAASDMLNYSRLRLGGVGGKDRGLLRPLEQEENYLEYLARIHVSVSVNISVALAVANSRTRSVALKPAPHGYVAPGPWEGFDHSYAAETAVSVPSDSNFHNVPLSTHTGEIELRYVTVPREEATVFRFLNLTNPLHTPLPEGPADVYVDGDYLLTSRLHTVAPNGTIELGLGAEEGVKVARNVRFTERTSGLLGGNLGLSHEITVDVTNNLSKDADIEVRERVPIVHEGDDKVSVQVTDVDPPWEPYDQDRSQIEGAYHWRLEVPAGTTRTLKANYEISLSAKHEIVGGNRREE